MTRSSGFDPFWMFRLPLSGEVNQRITAPEEPLRRLEQAVAEIEAIKHELKPSALEAAQTALDRLAREAPGQYETLFRERLDSKSG